MPCPSAPASLPDRKSTRLNSCHMSISYAVFCLKKKKKRESLHLQAEKKYTITTLEKREAIELFLVRSRALYPAFASISPVFHLCFFFLMLLRPLESTLFPYTTLFR